MHSWPFPCERGKIIDPESVLHAGGANVVFIDPSGGATAIFFAANQPVPVDERLRWVELATGATISRAMALQQATVALDDAQDTVSAANRSAIGQFIDGLVASPPVCEWVAGAPMAAVMGTIMSAIQPPSEPPNWEDGEQLSGIDLLSIGTRFQVAAAAVDAVPLREDFLAAATRLFDVGAERL